MFKNSEKIDNVGGWRDFTLLLMKPQICTKIKEIITKQLVQNFLVILGK